MHSFLTQGLSTYDKGSEMAKHFEGKEVWIPSSQRHEIPKCRAQGSGSPGVPVEFLRGTDATI